MTDNIDRWIPASQALTDVTGRIAAGLGIDRANAWREAANAILERLAAGTMLASPRGFLLNYEGQDLPLRYWFELRQIEPDGRESANPPIVESDWNAVCIPSGFWRVFKKADATARADWASGDFYISEFEDPVGIWSGVARDVHFDRHALPGAGLSPIGHADQASNGVQRSEYPTNKGGARPTFDWHRAIAHVVALADSQDGLDPTLKGHETNASHIARLLEAWFIAQGDGIPGGSQLRKYASMIVGEIHHLRAEKSATTK